MPSEPTSTRSHPRFGTLTFDRRLEWYEARATLGGAPIELYLTARDEASLDAALRTASELWDDQPRWTQRVRDFAVAVLLPLKNDGWLDDDEEPVTAAAFTQKMTLRSIAVDSKGGFDFLHDDGDLFLGHAIQITGTLNDGPTGADIPG